MKREYSDFPILTVGGIIFIDNAVVLIKRKYPPEAGKWTIPGGAVRMGELIEDALKREIIEETGLTIKVNKLIEIAEKVIRDEEGKIKYHYIILDYLCEYISGSVTASSDAEEIKTVHIKNINEMELIEGTEEVIKKCLNFC